MNEFKRIADSVHGTIAFNEPEIEIINTRIFQRLRNIKHLGLAYLVYPSADFSRFSHSLGTCHITGRILETLKKECKKLDEKVCQLYRIAALLHDIGHYPFSHVFERSLKDYYKDQTSPTAIVALLHDIGHYPYSQVFERSLKDNFQDQISLTASDEEILIGKNIEQMSYLSHEDITREIILKSSEINHILSKYKIDEQEIISILMNDINCLITNIISSDLDADRIDYLLRTSKCTSLPYGTIDCDYLISQIRYDSENRKIVLDRKALKTADHFLLSRYFAYQQLTYHKAVVGMELIFQYIIKELIKAGKVECHSEAIINDIKNGQWITFDDLKILNIIRDYRTECKDEHIKYKIDSLLNRIPPSLVFEEEFIGEKSKKREIVLLKDFLINKKSEWAKQFDIDDRFWIIWDNEGKKLTEIESLVPFIEIEDKDEQEKEIRKLKSLDIKGINNGKSIPIVSIPSSLMNILSNYVHFCLRLYIILPKSKIKNKSDIVRKINKTIRADITKLK